jgi:integrase
MKKKKVRHQQGHLYKEAGSWYVRFRQDEMEPDGSVKRRQRAVRLAPVCREYRTKRDVEPRREELFQRLALNSRNYNAQATMSVGTFVEEFFIPNYVANLKPSVREPYGYIWRRHLKPLCGQYRLRDFRTAHGQQVMNELAERGLGRNSVKRLKSLLSGIFSEAMRQGVVDEGKNPMREVRIPSWKMKPPKPTRAYTLEEIQRMLNLPLPETARAVIATFAFTGMRKGEVEGLRWENWQEGALWVERSHWCGYFTEPKTEESKAPVPVIAPLAAFLESHRNGHSDGPIFRSSRGTPLNLHNLANRVIRPAFRNAGLEWHGWHAFRRGLATNLKQMGVDDKTIQAILRHGDYDTTMNAYVKAVPESVQKAMQQFESLVSVNCAVTVQ